MNCQSPTRCECQKSDQLKQFPTGSPVLETSQKAGKVVLEELVCACAVLLLEEQELLLMAARPNFGGKSAVHLAVPLVRFTCASFKAL